MIAGALFLLFLAPPPGSAAGNGSPQTLKEKESYSIGYQVGAGMKYDGVEVDFEKFLSGLRDGVGGNEPGLRKEEMKRLILDLKKRSRETAMRNLQVLIVRNAEESERFLEENGKKAGVTTTESGLQYQVLKAGDGAVPRPDDEVQVHYRGTFIDGREFDSSLARGEPQTIRTDGVIKGWTEALRMMKAGSKWRIFVPPHLAYGRTGLGEKIPPNTVLVFELELLPADTADTKVAKESAR